jgi:hypothetical protein
MKTGARWQMWVGIFVAVMVVVTIAYTLYDNFLG